MAESQTKYQLCAFPMRARAEFIRFIFHQAGVDFIDHAVPKDKWRSMVKPRTPLGHVPVIHVSGDDKLGECLAIGDYLARQYNLAGATPLESAKCLMFACGMIDLLNRMEPWIRATVVAKDTAKANDEWAKIADYFKEHCGNYNKHIEASTSGWIVGNQLTWADLIVGEVHQRIEDKVTPKAFDEFPKLREHYKKVFALPNIAKHVAQRSEQPF
jgi:glutathione S-transferase